MATEPPHPFPLVRFARVGSTNDTILEAGERGAPEGTIHLADAQTAGRGRRGRTWWSAEGAGLWMSILLRPARPRADWGGLALVAGDAVRASVASLGARGVGLEWPNDLVIGSRKLGGILCEARGPLEAAWVAVGIGLDLDLTSPEARAGIPEELRGRITCLASAGVPPPHDREEIAQRIAASLWSRYRRFLATEAIDRIVETSLAEEGRPAVARLPDGRVLRGEVAGIGPSGELLLRHRSGRVTALVSAEVEYP